MCCRRFGTGVFLNAYTILCFHDVRTDRFVLCTVIGILAVDHFRSAAKYHEIRIGKERKHLFADHTVKGTLLIKQEHAVTIQVQLVITQLTDLRQTPVGIQRVHKFIIRVRIVEMHLFASGRLKDLLQCRPAERLCRASIRIILDPGIKTSQVVFSGTGKILHPQTVFDRNDDTAVLFGMLTEDLHKPAMRFVVMDIAAGIFQHADQKDIVIIGIQRRFDIFKIAHHDGHIVRIFMTVGIDQTAFLGKFHTGERACLFGKHTGNSPAAGPHFQNLCPFGDAQPGYDVFPQIRQMIQDRPVFTLRDNRGIFGR